MREKGSVLLIVLILIASVVIVVYEGFRMVNIDSNIALRMKGYFIAKHRALSGISYAKLILIMDERLNNYDSLLDIWAQLSRGNLPLPPGMDSNYVRISIEDEASKIPVNYLVDGKKGRVYAKMLKDLLMSPPFDLSEEKAESIVGGIRNWIDSRNYRWIPPPWVGEDYRPKDAPLTCLGELLLIPGISRRLYFGVNGSLGLRDILTVYSDRGLININTCPKVVLRAMADIEEHDMDLAEDFAQSVDNYRRDKFHREMLSSTNWIYVALPEFEDLNLPQGIITTSSSYFKIVSTGISGSSNCTIVEYVKRKDLKIKTLFVQIF